MYFFHDCYEVNRESFPEKQELHCRLVGNKSRAGNEYGGKPSPTTGHPINW